MSAGAFALYPMTFYELQPQYLCRADPSQEWESCKPEDFCEQDPTSGPLLEHKVDTESDLSLHNWVIDYGMQCAPKYQFGLFGSMFFFAVVLSSILLTPLADRFGRRPILLIGTAMNCITQTVMLFSESRQLTYGLVFILGLGMPMNVFVGYIYAMELIPANRTSYVSAVTMGNDGLVIAVASIWFQVVSKNWKTIFATATVLLYATHFLAWSMPESPAYLLTRGRYNEARAVMTSIARKNRVKKLCFNEAEAQSFGAVSNESASDGPVEYTCKWEPEVAKSRQ